VARLRPQKNGHDEAEGLDTPRKLAEVEGRMRGESATMKNEEPELVCVVIIRRDEGEGSGRIHIEEGECVGVRL
jgi:hypothetical protein